MEMPFNDPNIIIHSHLLNESFNKWTNQFLLDPQKDPVVFSENLYKAPFVVLSHSNQEDPVFTYANEAAQKLWGYNWDEFINLPSRLSAETDFTPERTKMLNEAALKGYINNYSSIRIAKNGQRFRIENVVLWNVLDEGGRKIGQAAAFNKWQFL